MNWLNIDESADIKTLYYLHGFHVIVVYIPLSCINRTTDYYKGIL